jgi:DNA-binding response OmpR family regulator
VNVLEVLLGRLRRKIGPEVIGTRRGQGYYLKVQ